MFNKNKIQKAILEENLEGWLFYIFHHRDKIACRLLDISSKSVNTRPWIYFIPAKGEPHKIVHGIESAGLDHLPGKKTAYISHNDLIKNIQNLNPDKYMKIAVQLSENQPVNSFLDAGTAQLLKEAGYRLVSSDGLIHRTMGTLSKKNIRNHEDTAEKLYSIIEESWIRLMTSFEKKSALFEGDISDFIMDRYDNYGLITNHPPIVASGVNSANPHYLPQNRGKKIKRNEIIQLDIWARQNTADAVYADISWVGFTGSTNEIPGAAEKMFRNLVEVREAAVSFIKERVENSRTVTGYEIDEHTRNEIKNRGYSDFIRHRTGHSIDENDHGCGVNLDSIEFPDSRRLIEGSCFSIYLCAIDSASL